jgi:hypothetical protein
MTPHHATRVHHNVSAGVAAVRLNTIHVAHHD